MAQKLTPKQEKFILLYIETGNASAAYRGAYNTGKMKPATINRNALALLQHNMIAARIDEIKNKAVEKAVLDEAWVISRLMRNAKICMGEEKLKVTVRPKDSVITVDLEITEREPAAANKALELLGKKLGIFIDRLETKNLTPVVPVINVTISADQPEPAPKAGPSISNARH